MIPYLKPTLFLNSITFATGFSVKSMYKFYDTNVLFSEYVVSSYFELLISITKTITSVRRPKMRRDAGVNAVFFFSKKTAFTQASPFIFGRPTDVMVLEPMRISAPYFLYNQEFWNI